MSELLPVRSPCISNCCLDDKDICLGCFRHVEEIVGWHSASELEKIKIIKNCDERLKNKKILK
ncbi:MAG: putative Fe-S protein YdhL (DUF1289 family) [Polaribacter sp.]|jgi:predicted Fe-S protein YdhL (DUF1289 family)